ncbi:MAG: CvpA family protein [Planctomycetota bacterium]
MVAIILGGIALYAARGAFAAAATFLITFIASLAAVNYYPLLEKLIVKVHSATVNYADGAAFVATYVIVFILLQYAAMALIEENIKINAVVNGLAGAIFGGLASTLFAGVLVITWFMMPGSVYFKDPDAREPYVTASVDVKFLDVVRFMSNDRISGRVPFDPGSEFLKTRTNKFTIPPKDTFDIRRGADQPSGRRGTAEADNLNLRRRFEEEEQEE